MCHLCAIGQRADSHSDRFHAATDIGHRSTAFQHNLPHHPPSGRRCARSASPPPELSVNTCLSPIAGRGRFFNLYRRNSMFKHVILCAALSAPLYVHAASGLEPSQTPEPNAQAVETSKPNAIQGMVRDTLGRPIALAKVTLQAASGE